MAATCFARTPSSTYKFPELSEPTPTYPENAFATQVKALDVVSRLEAQDAEVREVRARDSKLIAEFLDEYLPSFHPTHSLPLILSNSQVHSYVLQPHTSHSTPSSSSEPEYLNPSLPILGLIILRFIPTGHSLSPQPSSSLGTAHILAIAVKTEFRGQGVGRRLVQTGLDQLRSKIYLSHGYITPLPAHPTHNGQALSSQGVKLGRGGLPTPPLTPNDDDDGKPQEPKGFVRVQIECEDDASGGERTEVAKKFWQGLGVVLVRRRFGGRLGWVGERKWVI